MQTVYLMRHGEVDNPHDVWYGNLKGFPMSARGREQVRLAAEKLRATGPYIAALSYSPRLRTTQSAEIAARVLDAGDVVADEDLHEWQTGAWEGRPAKDLYEKSGYYGTPMRIPGPETLEDMAKRVRKVVDKLRRKHQDGDILIVGHREPLVSYLMALLRRPWEKIHDFEMPHAAVWKIKFDDKNGTSGIERVA
jgi:broad specificity phosphatase PhoE